MGNYSSRRSLCAALAGLNFGVGISDLAHGTLLGRLGCWLAFIVAALAWSTHNHYAAMEQSRRSRSLLPAPQVECTCKIGDGLHADWCPVYLHGMRSGVGFGQSLEPKRAGQLMISDTLFDAASEIRRYLTDPRLSPCYENALLPKIVELLERMDLLRTALVALQEGTASATEALAWMKEQERQREQSERPRAPQGKE